MKKTTSKNLSKRLSRYGSLSLALAGVATANGQIVYHDVNPDFDGSSDYYLNLNPDDGMTPAGVADAIDDFRIFSDAGTDPAPFVRILVERLGSNSLIASSALYTYPLALSSNYTISNSNTNWTNQQFQTLAFSYTSTSACFGNWCTSTDKYLGLRFDINGNTHYGWAKLDVNVNAGNITWSVKEYAFNMTPDEAIDAGQKTLGVDEMIFSKTKIVALHKTISLYNLPESTDYKLYTITGQSVLEGRINQNTYVIEANTMATGLYVLEVRDHNSGAMLKKKVLL